MQIPGRRSAIRRVVVSGGGSALAVSGRTPRSPAVPASVSPPTKSRRVKFIAQLLFDYLVRAQQQRRWDRQAEHIGGLEVDDEVEVGGLLDRQVGGLRALEDPRRWPRAAPTQECSGYKP